MMQPIAVLVLHQERPGWLALVTGRIRWRLLAWLAPLALVVVLVFYGLGTLSRWLGADPGMCLRISGLVSE